jgi:hypothetical protein
MNHLRALRPWKPEPYLADSHFPAAFSAKSDWATGLTTRREHCHNIYYLV